MFSKDRALQRAMEKAVSKYSQSADRMGALDKLSRVGTDDALLGLCKRFSIACDKTIEDQTEKRWVVDTLVSKGAAALPAIRRYMKDALSLHYPLIVVGQVADHDTALEIIDEVLAGEPPGYTRDPERRIDIIAWLGEWEPGSAEETAKRVIPYLADFDENVRYKAVDSIALKPHESAALPLVAALTRAEEESRRLRLRIGEVLAENKWSLGDQATSLEPFLQPGQPLAAYVLTQGHLEKQAG